MIETELRLLAFIKFDSEISLPLGTRSELEVDGNQATKNLFGSRLQKSRKYLKCHRQNVEWKIQESITKICHQHTNLIFNLSRSSPLPSHNTDRTVRFPPCSEPSTNKHISFIHYSCTRCCRTVRMCIRCWNH